LLLSFSFGPAFFALINTSIRNGYKAASILAFGIVFSDFILCLLIIFLVHFGASNFIQDEKSQRFMGVLAGIVLIIFGAFYFKKQTEKSEDVVIDVKTPSALLLLLKGFFLNSLNPTVWLLWLGNVTAVSKSLGYSLFKMIVYFSITLGIVLLVELAKNSMASKLKQFLKPKTMYVVNNITGSLLVICGLVLIYNHFFDRI
jgi:threonine/homoserine/homoserine lactone efflux protein